MSEKNEVTAEELAALDAVCKETGLVEGWEYFNLFRKRGNPDIQVVGPFNWPHRIPRPNVKLVRRKKVTSYGKFEAVQFDVNGDAIEDTPFHAFVRWIASLDDPENAEERLGVTPSEIIAKATAIVKDAENNE
ncbi:hypothetical protein ACIBCT_35395 [Streptosporangium sp. NPDC050855]|uniref:hypothetical protein n=1 Tax=Streptosporangium sp. NPDC050855 TaxID=3366194 RepID=UPI00379D7C97